MQIKELISEVTVPCKQGQTTLQLPNIYCERCFATLTQTLAQTLTQTLAQTLTQTLAQTLAQTLTQMQKLALVIHSSFPNF